MGERTIKLKRKKLIPTKQNIDCEWPLKAKMYNNYTSEIIQKNLTEYKMARKYGKRKKRMYYLIKECAT